MFLGEVLAGAPHETDKLLAMQAELIRRARQSIDAAARRLEQREAGLVQAT